MHVRYTTRLVPKVVTISYQERGTKHFETHITCFTQVFLAFNHIFQHGVMYVTELEGCSFLGECNTIEYVRLAEIKNKRRYRTTLYIGQAEVRCGSPSLNIHRFLLFNRPADVCSR